MKTVTAEKIFNLLLDAGITSNPYFFDENYIAPAKDWVLFEYSDALRIYLSQLPGYKKERNDCDNFAGRAVTLAKDCLAVSTEIEGENDLAVGPAVYMDTQSTLDVAGVKHALQVWIVENKGVLEVLFYEPQTQKAVKLSREQIGTIEFSAI